MQIENDVSKKIRYPIASSWTRIICRVLDSAFILLVVIGIAFLIFATDPNYNGTIDIINVSYQSWRYLIFSLLAFIVFFIYFVVVPYFWNGKTIFKFLFKIRVCNLIFTKNFFLNLIKRESILWMIVSFTNILVGLTCTIYGENAKDFINYLLVWTEQNTDNISYIVLGTIYQIMYSIASIILLIVIIYMCFKNKKRGLQDLISDTTVIKINGVSSDKDDNKNSKISSSKKNYGLPGEILPGSLEEIDSL